LALSPIVLTIPHANVNFAVFSEAKAQLHNLLNDIERKLKRPVEVILVFFSLANAGAELYRRRHRAGACGPAGPQAGGDFADGLERGQAHGPGAAGRHAGGGSVRAGLRGGDRVQGVRRSRRRWRPIPARCKTRPRWARCSASAPPGFAALTSASLRAFMFFPSSGTRAGAAVVELSDVTRSSWSGRFRTETLAGASFEASEAEGLGILARGGIGKSTLINTMAGIERPDEREVMRTGVADALSGAENVRFIARINDPDPERAEAWAADFSESGPHFRSPARTYFVRHARAAGDRAGAGAQFRGLFD
jgi:ABC-type multidrug transport system fused ATPase/permease subunit